MKKVYVNNNVFLVCRKSKVNRCKLDYYFLLETGEELYAFTKKNSVTCYKICKSPISVNKVLYSKKKDIAFMNMVKYLNFMMPYFVEYYELDGRKKSIS